ncbi:MAG: hypothetical protein ABIM89_19070 [Mycobacteriales bacterium]
MASGTSAARSTAGAAELDTLSLGEVLSEGLAELDALAAGELDEELDEALAVGLLLLLAAGGALDAGVFALSSSSPQAAANIVRATMAPRAIRGLRVRKLIKAVPPWTECIWVLRAGFCYIFRLCGSTRSNRVRTATFRL